MPEHSARELFPHVYVTDIHKRGEGTPDRALGIEQRAGKAVDMVTHGIVSNDLKLVTNLLRCRVALSSGISSVVTGFPLRATDKAYRV